MEIYGNPSTYNLENVLRQNILTSDYYRNTCLKLSSWEEVIDEIYYSVKDVEPWMSGNARGPSSAFSLLHRLFTLRLTEQQVRDTIRHEDSPYIRAVSSCVCCGSCIVLPRAATVPCCWNAQRRLSSPEPSAQPDSL